LALGVLGICIGGTLFAFGLCAPLLFFLSAPNTNSMLLPLLLAA
jgi:hypothetical protein